MKHLTIGQVAKASNVNIETVRYYERRGLIEKPPRTESGYRDFPLQVIKQIKFIKKSQELGFSLEEIKKLLFISENDATFDSEEIHHFAVEKIKEIQEKIADLHSMKHLLMELADKCPRSGISKEHCPIINNLKGEDKHG